MRNVIKLGVWWLAVFCVSYLAVSFTTILPVELADFNARFFEVASSLPQRMLNRDLIAGVGMSSSTTEQNASSVSAAAGVQERILPDRIIISKIGVDAPVNNPQSRDITVLDGALQNGVVRYPGSGGLDDTSNMFLFGHSTNWAVVHNQAYKSFNRLGELQIGDIVQVESGDRDYRYRVFSVSLVDKNQALVEFETGEKVVTLSTCDTFGERSNRFVVKAQFVQSLPR